MQRQKGYISFSNMIDIALTNLYDRHYGKSTETESQAIDQHHALTTIKLDAIKTHIELVEMSINKKGLTPKIAKAMFDVREIVLNRGEMSRAEIHKQLKQYDQEIIDSAIIYLVNDFGDIGSQTKKSNTKKRRNKNDKKKKK